MESCSFQSQLLSVMEVLAKAAVAEINRRVDESCAVLRLEVSQSQRDIDLLKRKCEGMEAELRRSRIRARRRVLHPPAAGRFSPFVKVVLNKDKQSTDWDRQMQTPSEPRQCVETEPATEAEPILIKEECSEEDMWRNDTEDKLSQLSGAEQLPGFEALPPARTDSFAESYPSAENPADPEALLSPAGGFDAFPEQQQQLNIVPRQTELIVKLEEDDEPDENAAPHKSGRTLTADEVDAPAWMGSLCREAGGPGVSYAEQQFGQTPAAFASQSSLLLEDAGVRVYSAGKSQSVLMSAARAKRRARTFGCKRPQPDDGHGALSQINSTGPSLIPQQLYDYHARNPNEDMTTQSPAASFYGHGRPSFSLARRMRTPWRPGLGEKRFGCTYCDKTFMRFSQLKEHLRSHTGEKPYSCAQCGRSFTKQCNLIRHAVVHSGEKPYECSLCGKCFTQRSSLKSHQKTVH